MVMPRDLSTSLEMTGSMDKRAIFNEASGFHAQTYADRQHQTAPRISIEDSWESSRRSGVSAARLQPLLAATGSGALFERRSKRFRRGHFVFRRGMGRGRDGRTLDSSKSYRAAHHSRSSKHGRKPDSRICADPGSDRYQSKTQETQQRVSATIWTLSHGRTQALHRQEISNEPGPEFNR